MFLKISKAYQIFCRAVPNKTYRWLIWVGVWTFIAVFAAIKRNYFYPDNQPLPWPEAIQNKLAIWYLWGSTVLVITWLAAKFRVTKENWTRNGLILISLSVIIPLAFLCVWSLYFHTQYAATFEKGNFSGMFNYALGHHSTFYYLFFWFVVGLEQAGGLHLKSVEKAVAEKELKIQLAQAQLQNLKNQLQPHFLFNTMNMISSMIESDPTLARDALVKLGHLLRTSINLTQVEETTLEKEMEFTSAFLDLQKARFNGRLKSKITISSDMKNAVIPSLTVQPLVENVIKHAVEVQDKEVNLLICADYDSENLLLNVEDDGPGMNGHQERTNGQGIGLVNLKNRLNMLHGNKASVKIQPSNSGGVQATVRVPLRFSDVTLL